MPALARVFDGHVVGSVFKRKGRRLGPYRLERRCPSECDNPDPRVDWGADVSQEPRSIKPVTVMNVGQAFERDRTPGFGKQRAEIDEIVIPPVQNPDPAEGSRKGTGQRDFVHPGDMTGARQPTSPDKCTEI